MNWKELTPNQIRNNEIDHVDELLEEFETKRLCDKIGCQIVIEYGFKGSKHDVWEQLLSYNENIKSHEFDDEFIKQLIERKERLESFDDELPKKRKAIEDAIKGRNLDDPDQMQNLINVTALIIEGNELLHEQKMCLCFNNK